jgi:VIT1/CCC1 family predicted Fe2+/Mn2+ transporter
LYGSQEAVPVRDTSRSSVDIRASDSADDARFGGGHREVTESWLRPAVFGVMDGLVSNVSLISGVGGGGVDTDTLILTGLAGLVAGGFSMATGEYTSVRSQNEAVQASIDGQVRALAEQPEVEQAEIAKSFEARGVRPEVASAVAEDLSADPEEMLRVHACNLLGIDPDKLASPWVAALSSFICFALGALIPLVPYLLGSSSLALALGISAVALFVVGVLVSLVTRRPPLYSGARQLLLGALSAGVTYVVGSLIGTAI